MYSESMRGSVIILRPSSTLHTLCLSHRTQILYAPDISMVLFQCDIKAGSVVVESGTGSGSLSTSIGKLQEICVIGDGLTVVIWGYF